MLPWGRVCARITPESGRGSHNACGKSRRSQFSFLCKYIGSAARAQPADNGSIFASRPVPGGSKGRGATQTKAAADAEVRPERDPETTRHRELDGGATCRPLPGEGGGGHSLLQVTGEGDGEISFHLVFEVVASDLSHWE